MAFGIYDTHTLLEGIQLIHPEQTFLKNRYFPTAGTFATNDVLVDIRDADLRMAEFVVRRKHGLTYDRIGYKTNRYTPPYIAPRTTLTIDELEQRGFGEALWSTDTPEMRAARFLRDDLSNLDKMIARREEKMCADVMFNNKIVMKNYADDLTAPIEDEISYFTEDSNPAVYTPDAEWDTSGADIIGDLAAMSRVLMENGNGASDLIVSPDVAAAIVNNDEIRQLLDNRRFEMGNINPSDLGPGVAFLGYLNAMGNMVGIYVYNGTYTDLDGSKGSFVPAKKVVLCAPGAGQVVYGAVTQIEEEDNAYHTREGARVPKLETDVANDVRTLTLKSCPIVAPRTKNPFLSATVLS